MQRGTIETLLIAVAGAIVGGALGGFGAFIGAVLEGSAFKALEDLPKAIGRSQGDDGDQSTRAH